MFNLPGWISEKVGRVEERHQEPRPVTINPSSALASPQGPFIPLSADLGDALLLVLDQRLHRIAALRRGGGGMAS